jgi:hypothetical protein
MMKNWMVFIVITFTMFVNEDHRSSIQFIFVKIDADRILGLAGSQE